MKITQLLFTTVLTVACLSLIGCGDKPATPAPTTPPAPAQSTTPADLQKTTTAAASDAQAAATKAAADAKAAADKAAADAKAQGDAVAQQFQAKYAQAKSLVTDKKYQDALTIVQQLSALQLTPDQQNLVNALKTQIQQLMATEGAKSASGLLKK